MGQRCQGGCLGYWSARVFGVYHTLFFICLFPGQSTCGKSNTEGRLGQPLRDNENLKRGPSGGNDVVRNGGKGAGRRGHKKRDRTRADQVKRISHATGTPRHGVPNLCW